MQCDKLEFVGIVEKRNCEGGTGGTCLPSQ